MKKISSFLVALVSIITLVSCPPIEPPKPPTNNNDGSYEKPYTVAEATTKSGDAYVKGYIVGFMQTGDNNYPVFSAETDSINTNILIADTLDNIEVYLPVQLPAGALREALNLVDNKDILGEELLIFGQLTTYFSMPGMRAPSYAVLNGVEIGTRPTDKSDLVYSHKFNSTVDNDFEAYNVLGDQTWEFGKSYVKMTGYVDGAYNANEDWLISPTISIPDEDVKFAFNYAIRYVTKMEEEAQVLVSENYEGGDPNLATWVNLNAEMTNGSGWSILAAPEISLNQFKGKTIRFAFKYTSDDKNACTWEIQSVEISKGKPFAGYVFAETFTKSLGDFKVINVTKADGLNTIWEYTSQYQCAKATGYYNVKNDGEGWLISPQITLPETPATLTFENAGNYSANVEEELTLWISETSDGNSVDEGWTQLTFTEYSSGSFNFVTAHVALDAYAGKTVRLALKYYSTPDMCATWEVRNFFIK